jgi:hypothetical protein
MITLRQVLQRVRQKEAEQQKLSLNYIIIGVAILLIVVIVKLFK